MGQAGVYAALRRVVFYQFERNLSPMSQDTHGFSVSADALHHATASGFAFAGQATESAAPATVAPDGKPAASGGGEMQQMILFIGVMFIMMYLVVLRPQKREKKERQQRQDKQAECCPNP